MGFEANRKAVCTKFLDRICFFILRVGVKINNLKLYRKRYIPNEIIHLKDDEIISVSPDKNIIITKWKALKPRDDIGMGVSCYYNDKGFKISKVFDNNKNFVYYYCDIIETVISGESIIFNDLILDIIVYGDGSAKIQDMDEFTDAFFDEILSFNILKKALNSFCYLINEIRGRRFSELSAPVDNIIL